MKLKSALTRLQKEQFEAFEAERERRKIIQEIKDMRTQIVLSRSKCVSLLKYLKDRNREKFLEEGKTIEILRKIKASSYEYVVLRSNLATVERIQSRLRTLIEVHQMFERIRKNSGLDQK